MTSRRAAPPIEEDAEPCRALAEQDVVEDAHVRAQQELLGHEADTGFHGFGRTMAEQSLALDRNVTGIGHDAAGRDADERRFARTVLTDDGEHLAFVDLHGDAVKGLHAAVRLGDVDDVEERDRRAGRGRHDGLRWIARGHLASLRVTA